MMVSLVFEWVQVVLVSGCQVVVSGLDGSVYLVPEKLTGSGFIGLVVCR